MVSHTVYFKGMMFFTLTSQMYHRISVLVPVLVRVPEYLSTSTSTSTMTLELTSTSTVRVPEIQYSSTASTSTEYEYPSPGTVLFFCFSFTNPLCLFLPFPVFPMIIANVRKLEHINLMVSAPFVMYILICCSKNPGIMFAYSWAAIVCVCYRIDVSVMFVTWQ